MTPQQKVLASVNQGQVYVSARTKSGRQWRIWSRYGAPENRVWGLWPLGERNKTGGVKPIRVLEDDLMNPKKWTLIG